ncbi:MAG: TIGR03809 family protein [Pseudolabrys sp.]|nr:TIGR03809 family protein [Pseudolabrys sp.]MBV9953799.1 TIGR03809 family protein [Pseudolabrys sp.]
MANRLPSDQDSESDSTMAARWSALAERRKAYYVELYKSGRWKHYFDEAEFLARMRDVLLATRTWNELAQREAPPALKRAS